LLNIGIDTDTRDRGVLTLRDANVCGQPNSLQIRWCVSKFRQRVDRAQALLLGDAHAQEPRSPGWPAFHRDASHRDSAAMDLVEAIPPSNSG
jgi:hypothetical protein